MQKAGVRKRLKVTSKGQITIPREIRRRLGVQPGDHIWLAEKGGAFQVEPDRRESPFEKYRGIGNPGIKLGRKAVIQFVRKLRGR
jgi:antitoxin PrlF